MAAIATAQQDGDHLILEAGTGTGKTVAALAASATTTAKDGRRLVYATRTNSQQAQVVAEHGALTAANQDPGLLIPFMGRRHYCPLLRSDPRFADGTAEELGRLCRDAKRKATQQHETGKPVAGGCPYYLRLLQDGPGPVEALLSEGGLDGGSLAARVEDAGSCPYEALKLLMPRARTVVVPYVFVLDERLRTTLLQWMGTGPSECHVLVDEAHNLPEAARAHFSPRLSVRTIERAQKEAEEYQDPLLAGSHLASAVLDALLRAIHRLRVEHVRADAAGEEADGLVPPGALDEALLYALRMPTTGLARVATDLERWGEAVREDRRAKGRLPRSHLGAVGAFLHGWMASRDAPYVQLVTGGDNPALELYLLDPASVLGWLAEFHSSVHMSGTLQPLADHRILCGLPATTRQVAIPSPFDPDHLRVYGMQGVHRRFEALQRDPTLAERQQRLAVDLLGQCPGRTGLFFPSHKMMEDYLEEGFLHAADRPLYVERQGMSTTELGEMLDAYRGEPSGRALLLAVMGGRLTEGIDFPGKAMEHLLVFGIPYPRPTARLQALVHHYDRVAGNGWQVVVHNPVGRMLRQAAGRLIRGPDDRGTVVVLDERVVRFHSHLARLRMVDDPDGLRAGPVPDGGYRTADLLPRKAPPGQA
ncbi:MAG: excision repair protein [Thermoplasmata archaeon]|nr:excision repair protein [Thermoplasmata archaeon]